MITVGSIVTLDKGEHTEQQVKVLWAGSKYFAIVCTPEDYKKNNCASWQVMQYRLS